MSSFQLNSNFNSNPTSKGSNPFVEVISCGSNEYVINHHPLNSNCIENLGKNNNDLKDSYTNFITKKLFDPIIEKNILTSQIPNLSTGDKTLISTNPTTFKCIDNNLFNSTNLTNPSNLKSKIEPTTYSTLYQKHLNKNNFQDENNERHIEIINDEIEIAHTKECGYSRELLLQRIDLQDKRIKYLEGLIYDDKQKEFEKLNNELLIDNQVLSNQIQLALEYLDVIFFYLNHYFNIIFHNDKRIKLHKFNPADLTDFLKNIEFRLYDLNSLADPNNPKNKPNPEIKIVYKTDPNTNDFINKLLSENANLKSQLNDFKELLNNYVKPRYGADELKKKRVVNFQLPDIEPSIKNQSEIDSDDDKRFRIKGKVKLMDVNNLYDKYSGKISPIFNAFGWAMSGVASKIVINKYGRKKLDNYGVHQNLEVKKKQIIPVKNKNYAEYLNKPKKDENVVISNDGFIKEKSILPIRKHKFD